MQSVLASLLTASRIACSPIPSPAISKKAIAAVDVDRAPAHASGTGAPPRDPVATAGGAPSDGARGTGRRVRLRGLGGEIRQAGGRSAHAGHHARHCRDARARVRDEHRDLQRRPRRAFPAAAVRSARTRSSSCTAPGVARRRASSASSYPDYQDFSRGNQSCRGLATTTYWTFTDHRNARAAARHRPSRERIVLSAARHAGRSLAGGSGRKTTVRAGRKSSSSAEGCGSGSSAAIPPSSGATSR